MHITFVCMGNTCRSPMAEGIARKIISEQYPDSGVTVSSAGVATYNGAPASQNAIDVCREIGVDLTAHRSRRLNPEIAERTDHFAVMTRPPGQILQQCGIPAEAIALPETEISDPYGEDEDTYRECRDEIYAAVSRLLSSLPSVREKGATE